MGKPKKTAGWEDQAAIRAFKRWCKKNKVTLTGFDLLVRQLVFVDGYRAALRKGANRGKA